MKMIWYKLASQFPGCRLGWCCTNHRLKIDAGTQPGKVLRLRGKGLPSVNGYGTGDLLVNVVYVPED